MNAAMQAQVDGSFITNHKANDWLYDVEHHELIVQLPIHSLPVACIAFCKAKNIEWFH